MSNLIQVEESDMPEFITIDGIQIIKDKFILSNGLYAYNDSLIAVDNNIVYSNHGIVDENNYLIQKANYKLNTTEDGGATINFEDKHDNSANMNIAATSKQSTLNDGYDMHTYVNKNISKSNAFLNKDSKQSKPLDKTTNLDVQSIVSNDKMKNLIGELLTNYMRKPEDIDYASNNANLISINEKEDVEYCLNNAIRQGLKIKNTLINLIKINQDKTLLCRCIIIHNSYLNYNKTGDQNKIIKAKDLFDDDRVDDEMQDFIKNSTLTNILTVSGRLDTVINTLKDNMCVAICLQIPYFSISKALEPGAWTRSVEYTFKMNSKIKKYKLYEMVNNLNVEQIDNLRACAPVIAFIMSTSKMSKFYTDKKIFEKQPNGAIVNPNYFIDACVKNINGANAQLVINKIRSNISKTLECLNNVTKEQYDEIIRCKTIVLKNTKSSDANTSMFNFRS